MTVAYGGSCVIATGTTSAVVDLTVWSDFAPTAPGSDLLQLHVYWGNSTNTAPPTPTGWFAPANNTVAGGSGTFGSNTGPRGVSVFYKVFDAADTSVTV